MSVLANARCLQVDCDPLPWPIKLVLAVVGIAAIYFTIKEFRNR